MNAHVYEEPFSSLFPPASFSIAFHLIYKSCCSSPDFIGLPVREPGKYNFLWVEDFPLFERDVTSSMWQHAPLTFLTVSLGVWVRLNICNRSAHIYLLNLSLCLFLSDKILSVHHPFTAPRQDHEDLLYSDPLKVFLLSFSFISFFYTRANDHHQFPITLFFLVYDFFQEQMFSHFKLILSSMTWCSHSLPLTANIGAGATL